MKERCVLDKITLGLAITALIVSLFAVSTLLTGCGGDDEAGDEPLPMDPDGLALKLQEGIEFKDQMAEVDSAVFYMLYDLTEEDADREVLITSSNATAEEIAVIHAASPDKVDKIKDAVQSRIETQRDGFTDYNPEELEKLAEPVVEQIGDYIVLCVSDDNKKAEEIIGQYK